MIEKIVKSVEELNVTAMHLRQSGDMETLRKLAKTWTVPYVQTEDFIQGKRYRLAEIPIAEKEFRTPFEKLREEMFVLNDKNFADIIGWYMINRCRENEALSQHVLKKHKSLQRCLDYITGKAFAMASEQARLKGMDHLQENTGLALTEREVFPWAEEYYHREDEDEAAKKDAEEKQKIRSAWETAERKMSNTNIVKAKKTTGAKAKKGSKKEEKDSSPAQRDVPETTKEKEAFGQISLFDLAQ